MENTINSLNNHSCYKDNINSTNNVMDVMQCSFDETINYIEQE